VTGTQQPTISRRLTLVMAIASGMAVANLYYAQPLLHSIATTFHSSASTTGLVVTLAQVGYALGLLLIVPVGDLLDRRKLILGVLGLAPLALVVTGLSPSLGFLTGASLAVGLTSVVAQVMVPFAASLAADAERGKVVGTVVSGILFGILLARTVSGIVADLTSWRFMYYLAAGAMALLVLLLMRELPRDTAKPPMSYGEMLRSVGQLLLTERVVRFRSAYGALAFATFSIFWTTVSFVLAHPPYNYSDTVIGLFGLIGAAGAMMASAAGRLADRGLTRAATGVLTVTLAGSFVLLRTADHLLVTMILGIIILDVAVQGLHVLNQSEIFLSAPHARSRVNSAYMTSYFLGGAAGSAGGAAIYQAYGWSGVCWLGFGLAGLAFLAWLGETRAVLRTTSS
jgi:predicted MFS family arabinose efflux permease